MKIKNFFSLSLFCVCINYANILHAQPAKGDFSLSMLEKFKYENAHGVEIKIPKDTKTVIVTSQKSSGILVNEFLESQNKGYLQKHKAIFVADISDIPTIFVKMVALPKFKKYKHEIYINSDEKLKSVVFFQNNKVTLLDIKEGRVENSHFISTKEELKIAIEKQ